jgi:hypothetical protein
MSTLSGGEKLGFDLAEVFLGWLSFCIVRRLYLPSLRRDLSANVDFFLGKGAAVSQPPFS